MEGKAAAVTTAGGHGSRGHENHRQVMAAEVTAAEVTAAVAELQKALFQLKSLNKN